MKHCLHCGTEVLDDAVVCPKCGCSVAYSTINQNEQSNGFAIAGFVCSFFIPLLGWVFGGIGLSKSQKLNGKGKSLSIAAIAIASVTFIIALIILLVPVKK